MSNKPDFDPPIVFYAPVQDLLHPTRFPRIERYTLCTIKGVRKFLNKIKDLDEWYEVDDDSREQFDAYLTMEALLDGPETSKNP